MRKIVLVLMIFLLAGCSASLKGLEIKIKDPAADINFDFLDLEETKENGS